MPAGSHSMPGTTEFGLTTIVDPSIRMIDEDSPCRGADQSIIMSLFETIAIGEPTFDVHIAQLKTKVPPTTIAPFAKVDLVGLDGSPLQGLFYAGGFCVYLALCDTSLFHGAVSGQGPAFPMSTFGADRGLQTTPGGFIGLTPDSIERFHEAARSAQDTYRRLKLGWCRAKRRLAGVSARMTHVLYLTEREGVVCEAIGVSIDDLDPDVVDAPKGPLLTFITFTDRSSVAFQNQDPFLSSLVPKTTPLWDDDANIFREMSAELFLKVTTNPVAGFRLELPKGLGKAR